MNTLILKTAGSIALGAAALGMAASPAEARRGWHDHYRGDRGGTAIVAGVAGLAIGAALASNNDRYRDRGYYDGGYYDRGYRDYRPRYREYNYDRRYRGYYRDCGTRWAYDPYLDRDVRVRYCR